MMLGRPKKIPEPPLPPTETMEAKTLKQGQKPEPMPEKSIEFEDKEVEEQQKGYTIQDFATYNGLAEMELLNLIAALKQDVEKTNVLLSNLIELVKQSG